MVTHLPIPKINVTNILPNSLAKTTDASPVSFTDNLVELDTIRETSEVRATGSAIFQGTEIQKKQVQKYVSRRREPRKKYLRRSTFSLGQDGEKWANYLEQHCEAVQELMKLTPNI